jgi:hypothetical protein
MEFHDVDRYIVSIEYAEKDGSKWRTGWSEYGLEGNTNAVESIGWELKTQPEFVRGTIQRVLPTGGTRLVYERTKKS